MNSGAPVGGSAVCNVGFCRLPGPAPPPVTPFVPAADGPCPSPSPLGVCAFRIMSSASLLAPAVPGLESASGSSGDGGVVQAGSCRTASPRTCATRSKRVHTKLWRAAASCFADSAACACKTHYKSHWSHRGHHRCAAATVATKALRAGASRSLQQIRLWSRRATQNDRMASWQQHCVALCRARLSRKIQAITKTRRGLTPAKAGRSSRSSSQERSSTPKGTNLNTKQTPKIFPKKLKKKPKTKKPEKKKPRAPLPRRRQQQCRSPLPPGTV